MTRDILAERREIDAAVEGMTLVDVMRRNATEHPALGAIHWQEEGEWRTLTWSQYREKVLETAAGLRSLGVGKGQFVAIMAGNRPEHVIADLGTVHVSATPVTFYNTLAPEQIAYIANNCEATVAVLENLEFMKRWEAIKGEVPSLRYVVLMEGAENYDTVDWVLSWDELMARGKELLETDRSAIEEGAGALTPDDIATLIYTSGTTGTPKGVEITHRNVVWTTECLRRAVDIEPGARMVSYLPLAHIAERMATHYMGQWIPGEVWYCPDMTQVVDYIQRARPNVFFAVPRVWEKIQGRLKARFAEDERKAPLIERAIRVGTEIVRAEQERRTPGLLTRIQGALFDRVVFSKVREGLGMDDVKIAITAAAPINPELIVWYRALGIPLYELYGSSETSGPATSNLPGDDKIGTVGKPLPGVEVELADDGEIMVRGGNIARGYYKMPEETAETFTPDGWLLTGDLGAWDDEGFLRIVGRKKDIIITAAGKNIAPAKLETLLRDHPLIAAAALVGDGRKYITALIALDPETAPEWAAEHGIEFTDLASFSQQPVVREEIQRAVDEANAHVSRVEQIKKFAIVPDAWSPETGELTPSLKMKRAVVYEKYADLIESLYAE